LEAELSQARQTQEALLQEKERLAPKPDSQGVVFPNSGNHRLGEVLDELTKVNTRIRSLESGIQQESRKENYEASVANAGAAIEAAVVAGQAATQAAKALTAKVQNIRQRIADMEQEGSRQEEQAVSAEADAARAYAQAVAGGNVKDERAAHAKLQSAHDAVSEIKRKRAQQAETVAIMACEAETLEAQVKAEQRATDEAQRALYQAAGTKLGAEWDAAVKPLLQVGARIAALAQSAGQYPYALERLRIPMFHVLNDSVTLDDLNRMAAPLSLADILLVTEQEAAA
jgi:predicted  nucleic acid-binding Zn-ribbon protein